MAAGSPEPAGGPMPAPGGGAGGVACGGREPLISLLVAATENGIIGRSNGMPWHLPDDLKQFRSRTLGKCLLMGRRTFESIGAALPGRTNLVLTRAQDFRPAGATAVHSLEEAVSLTKAAGVPELVVGGGAEVYRLALPCVRRIHLTRIHAVIDGDTALPPIRWEQWREVARQEHPADARHAWALSFITLERG